MATRRLRGPRPRTDLYRHHEPNADQKSTALFYDDRTDTVFQADVEEESQRFVTRDDSERSLEPTDTLGEVLEDVGDRLEWDSLSAFGREQLQSDDEQESETDAASPDSMTFTQSNVSESAAHDLEFSGSYLYQAQTRNSPSSVRSKSHSTTPRTHTVPLQSLLIGC